MVPDVVVASLGRQRAGLVDECRDALATMGGGVHDTHKQQTIRRLLGELRSHAPQLVGFGGNRETYQR